MDCSGLFGIMKGLGGCVVGYEFTRFAWTIIRISISSMFETTLL